MAIPANMLAIEIQAGKLVPVTRPVPSILPGTALIKVMAAGVNRPDVMQRQGKYPPPPGASDIPGLEVAGTVVALGDHTNNLKVGDKVCALITGGGYAEYCLAPTSLCLPMPENLGLIEAAGIPETFFTVWSNVFDRAGLKSGESLLAHGGSSGIGTTAIQLAKAFNAKVIVTAGSDAKCRFCSSLGADLAINYRNQDFVEAIRDFTRGAGVTVILDMIGGEYFPRNIQCLAEEGRLVQIAIQHGAKSDINLLPIMLKRLTVTGSTLRARSDAFKASIADSLYKNVWPFLISGKIKPIINSTFTLDDAACAHELMESGAHMGKIILITGNL
jgi:NADPH2:quinone reductase